MSKRRVLHTVGRCLGAAAVMAMGSAEGEIPKGTPVEVVGWFRRSSQFYLHLKCIACTIPVCVFGVTKRIQAGSKTMSESAGILYSTDYSPSGCIDHLCKGLAKNDSWCYVW